MSIAEQHQPRQFPGSAAAAAAADTAASVADRSRWILSQTAELTASKRVRRRPNHVHAVAVSAEPLGQSSSIVGHVRRRHVTRTRQDRMTVSVS